MAEDLYTGFGNQKILAERAKKDINGNSLALTIENEKVTAIGGVSIGGGSEPVDAYTKTECDSQFMAKKKLTGTATIAGREYKTVTIGNQVWMAENLDMKFDGLTVGSTEPPSMEDLRANYYNNDEETYGAEGNQYGLLYNYPAVKYINDNRATLIPGWHVPTEEEFFTLFRNIGETFDVGTTSTTFETAGLKLKSSSGWDQQSSGETGNGIDAFGMSVIPSGLHTGTFTDIGRVGNLWTMTTKVAYQAQSAHFSLDQHAVIYPWYYGNEVGVRLVKDSDNSDDLWRKYDDKEFDAKHSDVAELAKKDINGNSLELHVNAEGKIDKIGNKYIEGTGEAPVDAYTKEETNALLDDKVDKVSGKGLSANDYTNADKDKLDNIESGAQVNLIASVKVAGSALAIDDKSVNVPEAGGTSGAWVKGVVSGEDTARWNSWVYASYNVPITGVTINGRKYPVVKIGNLLWMAENLDYRWTGLAASYDYGSTTEPRANYYNNDSATYGDAGNKYGLLYNRPAAKYLEDHKTELGIPVGWRVPTSTDVSALLNFAGTNGAKIKSIDGWNETEWAGTNETGFNLYPTGRWSSNSFSYVGRMSVLWTCSDGANNYYPTLYVEANNCMGGTQNPNTQYGIRLVKTLI